MAHNINSGETLSVFTHPGQDIRIPTSKSQSLLTFGSFRLERDFQPDGVSGETQPINFGPFSTLDNMQVEEFEPRRRETVENRELNFNKEDPLSYSYFSSFYSTVATAINNIVENYPYAIFAYDKGTGNTIINYSTRRENLKYFSTFRIPYSSATNQGNVLINSGRTDEITLVQDTSKFAIQFSGSNTIYPITKYKYISPTGNTSFLEFEIEGLLYDQSVNASQFQDPIYIRPTKRRLNNYLSELSRIENQVWLEQKFLIPKSDDERVEEIKEFIWPKTIDGFNPDTYGIYFENYKNNLLNDAERVDDTKTNIMMKALLPQNFLEQDTDENDFRKLTEMYSQQFDEIKQFIDSIAFAHNINYREEESVPNKFLFKLSKLLGWELSNSFNELNLFEYLTGDIEEGKQPLAKLNVEIWKRILININWLYKRKGTRDALQFIFKLIGAPECLINLNEFVYEINKVVNTNKTPRQNFAFDFNEAIDASTGRLSSSSGTTQGLSKVNESGYINYNASQFIFQEGGNGRGNGQDYINQWEPPFEPTLKVDNVKIEVGDSQIGTQDIINTKELEINVSPAAAIECDVLNWLQSTGTSWVWGTTGDTYAFSSLTVPFEYLTHDQEDIEPSAVSGMSFSQFAEYIYARSIDPTTRKTAVQEHTSYWYQELKNLYLFYYLNNSPRSNRLTFGSLEFFVELLEVQFQDYFYQLIPATSIFEGIYTEYRNTLFNRQKFVYKEGINKGSEFQTTYNEPLEPQMNFATIEESINDKISDNTKVIHVKGNVPVRMSMNMNPVLAVSNFPTQIETTINPVAVGFTAETEHTSTTNIDYDDPRNRYPYVFNQ